VQVQTAIAERHFCSQGGCSCGDCREMVENAGKNVVNYCLIQYIVSAHTTAFGSQFVSYGQIGFHLDRLQATFWPCRRSPQLDLLATFAAKARSTSLAYPDLHLDPTRTRLAGKTRCNCRRFVTLHGQKVVLQTSVCQNKSDQSERNAS